MAAGGLRGSTVSRPQAPLHGLADGLPAGWGCWLAGVTGFGLRGASFSNSEKLQKSERRLSFRLCDPGEPPQPEVAGGSGRRVLWRGLAAHYLARRWCTTALVALRGGCPLSRAVRRPAFAVTVSSVIRGGDEPQGELSVLARKRSGDRGDLSFPVVTSIG